MVNRENTLERIKLKDKNLFEELSFIRLDENWQESKKDYVLSGDLAFDQRIFHRYQLKWAPHVTLDFWYRGAPISEQSAKRLMSIEKIGGKVDIEQLKFLGELLGVAWQDGCLDTIMLAEIGTVNQRTTLAVQWQQNSTRRKFLSLYIDSKGDGKTIREIHYSAPAESFDSNMNFAAEAFRSIQWSSSILPPPLSTAAV